MTLKRWAEILYSDLNGVQTTMGAVRDFYNLLSMVNDVPGDYIVLKLEYNKFPWIYHRRERGADEAEWFIYDEHVKGNDPIGMLKALKRQDKKMAIPFLVAYRVGKEERVNWEPVSYVGRDGLWHLDFVRDRNKVLREIRVNRAVEELDKELSSTMGFWMPENEKTKLSGEERLAKFQELTEKRMRIIQQLEEEFEREGIHVAAC